MGAVEQYAYELAYPIEPFPNGLRLIDEAGIFQIIDKQLYMHGVHLKDSDCMNCMYVKIHGVCSFDEGLLVVEPGCLLYFGQTSGARNNWGYIKKLPLHQQASIWICLIHDSPSHQRDYLEGAGAMLGNVVLEPLGYRCLNTKKVCCSVLSFLREVYSR
jgi:hypothetical protein